MKHTFENFKVDESNATAFNICQKLANEETISPRIIHFCGATGVGKTHLLEALRHHLEEERHLDVELMEGKQLVEFFIGVFKSCQKTEYPITKMFPLFAHTDVLMIDNIQYLIGKSSTQELVSELISDMIQAGKTVIFTSEDAFVSYLKIHELPYEKAHISLPQYFMKRNYLNSYVEKHRLFLRELETRKILRASSTIRELNAILNQVAFLRKIEPGMLGSEMLEKILKERGRPV